MYAFPACLLLNHICLLACVLSPRCSCWMVTLALLRSSTRQPWVHTSWWSTACWTCRWAWPVCAHTSNRLGRICVNNSKRLPWSVRTPVTGSAWPGLDDAKRHPLPKGTRGWPASAACSGQLAVSHKPGLLGTLAEPVTCRPELLVQQGQASNSWTACGLLQ